MNLFAQTHCVCLPLRNIVAYRPWSGRYAPCFFTSPPRFNRHRRRFKIALSKHSRLTRLGRFVILLVSRQQRLPSSATGGGRLCCPVLFAIGLITLRDRVNPILAKEQSRSMTCFVLCDLTPKKISAKNAVVATLFGFFNYLFPCNLMKNDYSCKNHIEPKKISVSLGLKLFQFS